MRSDSLNMQVCNDCKEKSLQYILKSGIINYLLNNYVISPLSLCQRA